MLTRSDFVRAVVLIGLSVAALLALSTGIRSGTPTGSQVATRELGEFDVRLEVSTLEGASSRTAPGIESITEFTQSHSGHWMFEIVTADLILDTRKLGEYNTIYYERPWSERGDAGRFQLVSGSWPEVPNEVAVSEELAGRYALGGPLMANSGAVAFSVTGVVRDRYFTDGLALFAAEGTWDGLDFERMGRLGAPPVASLQLYGKGVDWRPLLGELAVSNSEPGSFDAGGGLVLTRDDAVAAALPPLTERSPMVYRIPSSMVVMATWLGWVGLGRRSFARRSRVLAAVGVHPAMARRVATVNVVLPGLLGLLIGGPLGWLASRLVRLGIASASTQPLRPLDHLPEEWLRLAVLSAGVMAMSAGALLHGAGQHRWANRPRTLLAAHWSGIRLGVTVLLVCYIGWNFGGSSLESDQSAIAWCSVALIGVWVGPFLDMVVSLTGRGALAVRMASRRLALDRVRSGLVIVALVVLVAPSLTAMVLRAGRIEFERSRWHTNVAAGQVAVISSGMFDSAPPSEVVELIEAETRARPTTLSLASFPGQSTGDIVQLIGVDQPSGMLGPPVASLADHIDLARLIPSLPASAASAYAEGTPLVFGASGRFQVVRLMPGDGGFLEIDRSAPFEAVGIEPDRAWSDNVSGFVPPAMLAEVGALPEPRFAVFNGVDASMLQRVRSSMRSSGLPLPTLLTYRSFEQQPISLSQRVGLMGQYALFLATLLLLATSISARMRRDLAVLGAIGTPPRWARRVAVRQVGSLLVPALLLGCVVASVSIAVTTSRLHNRPIVVPWSGLATLFASVAALTSIALGTVLWSARRHGELRQESVMSLEG